MSKVTNQKRWETRPLECWDKAKALRRDFEEGRVKAAERSQLLVDGRDTQIFAGFGNLQSAMTNPLGAMIAWSSNKFSRECLSAAECQGLGREICGYHRDVFGSMYLNRDMLGGPFPRRDISIPTPAPCDQHSLRGKPVADYFNIPRFQGEAPVYSGPRDPQRDKAMIEHRVAELMDEIEWLEKVSGRKFNDDIFRENIIYNLRIRSLAGEVCCLNQNIPAPLDLKMFYSFYTLGDLTRGDLKATEDLWRELRDEVKWRVDNQIAAVATERYRWLEDEPPPWHFLKYYRYMAEYGAVCIGSPYTHGIGGPYEWRGDGTYGPTKNPLELGWPLNTREEIIRANVAAFSLVGRDGREIADIDSPGKSRTLLNMVKAFHVDGVIRPLWRAGVGCDYGSKEIGLALSGAGVSVMHYEGSQPGDRTDFDENRMLDQLDTWMESQGLRKLEY